MIALSFSRPPVPYSAAQLLPITLPWPAVVNAAGLSLRHGRVLMPDRLNNRPARVSVLPTKVYLYKHAAAAIKSEVG